MRKFNITGVCVPQKHYMVNIDEKLNRVVRMIEDEEYFTIHRARQYGKTTMLAALYQKLKEHYIVLRLSFEGLGENAFRTDISFVKIFMRHVGDFMELTGEKMTETALQWKHPNEPEIMSYDDAFDFLGRKITELCKSADKDIILMIDEVDKSTDNQVFLNFLGMLRNKYLKREEGLDITFKSVILAGVYDIKNLKLRFHPDEEKKYNSPWNIAADFKIDMSFSPQEIATMLSDYEKDYHTGMDILAISREIFFYTSGYPFLVSSLCKWVDEDGNKEWTAENLRIAEKELLKCRNTLFDDLIKNVENNKDLKKLITKILYNGYSQVFNLADPVIQKGAMLGIFSEKQQMVAISNIMFETYLYDYLVSINSRNNMIAEADRNQFVKNGRLNVPLLLTHFQQLMKAEYRPNDEKFVEQQGRLLFLCFLKPVINGTGFYYVEPETRNNTRMDIVVAYGGEEHIIELKIWHGKAYRKQGITQLEDYMEHRNADKGYLLSFSFLKEKQYTAGWLDESETMKRIFEVVT